MKIAILLVLVLNGVRAGAAPLVLSGINGSLNSDISWLVVKEAYAQLGVKAVWRRLPAGRSLQMADAGKGIDGELFRISGVARRYPNLIRVPTPVNRREGTAFARQDLTLNGWSGLARYRVGIQTGIKFAERGTRGIPRTVVSTNEQLFRMLAGGRIDVIVVSLVSGLKTLKQLRLSGVHPLRPPLQSYDLYHYLHKKHRSLVPGLNAVLQKMQADGRTGQIRRDFIQNFMKSIPPPERRVGSPGR